MLNTLHKNQYRIAVWNANVTSEDVSDAYFREWYAQHSAHIIIDGTGTVTMQVSNVESPALDSDDDWVDIATYSASSFIPMNYTFRWIRFKRNATTVPMTINLLSGGRINS